jgi:hypothetical protein
VNPELEVRSRRRIIRRHDVSVHQIRICHGLSFLAVKDHKQVGATIMPVTCILEVPCSNIMQDIISWLGIFVFFFIPS